MKQSEHPRSFYGAVYHADLRSPEVEELRRLNWSAYGFWLHLQALTYKDRDRWYASVGQLSYELGKDPTTIRRWARELESLGLVRRQVGAQEREEQVWVLLVPPSVARRVQPEAANVPRESLEDALVRGLQADPEQLADPYSLREHRAWLLACCQPTPEALERVGQWLRGGQVLGWNGSTPVKSPRQYHGTVRARELVQLLPNVARQLVEALPETA